MELKFIFKNAPNEYGYLIPNAGAIMLLAGITTPHTPRPHFHIVNTFNLRCERIVKYKDNDKRNVDVTFVNVDCECLDDCYAIALRDLINLILKDFNFIYSCSYQYVDDDGEICNAFYVGSQSQEFKGDEKHERPLEFFFAHEYLSQEHVDRDTMPEEHIEIAEKFDLYKYPKTDERHI